MQMLLFKQPIQIVVRKGFGSIVYDKELQAHRRLGLIGYGPRSPEFTDEIERVDRIPRDHSGWKSIRYANQRFQLFGGIRTPFFICVNSPI